MIQREEWKGYHEVCPGEEGSSGSRSGFLTGEKVEA